MALPSGPSSVVQKLSSNNMSGSGVPSTPTANAAMGMKDENWPDPSSAALKSQPTSQWNETAVAHDPMSSGVAMQPSNNYHHGVSAGSHWNNPGPPPNHHSSDDWFREGVVDTSDWSLPVRTERVITPNISHVSIRSSRVRRTKLRSILTKVKSIPVIGSFQVEDQVAWVDHYQCP
jgi:hypothetical protein